MGWFGWFAKAPVADKPALSGPDAILEDLAKRVRRDVEDAGAWTPVAYHSGAAYASKDAALSAAVQTVAWLAEARK